MTPLEQSIEHWKRLATGTSRLAESVSMKDCALCAIYAHNSLKPDRCCIECPVAIRVGDRRCRGTPYDAVYAYINEHKHIAFIKLKNDEAFQALAQKELEFLQSLQDNANQTKQQSSN